MVMKISWTSVEETTPPYTTDKPPIQDQTSNMAKVNEGEMDHRANLIDKITELERRSASMDLALAGNEVKLLALETTSFDGTLVWRINDVTRRRQEAINGRTPSIYSTPFYTSRAGYKMCVRIYLNGDGMGKGTHISLFFVLMRGQYDAILPWPFKQKVTLMLLDQNNREHVIEAFRLDPKSPAFHRPAEWYKCCHGLPSLLSSVKARRLTLRPCEGWYDLPEDHCRHWRTVGSFSILTISRWQRESRERDGNCQTLPFIICFTNI